MSSQRMHGHANVERGSGPHEVPSPGAESQANGPPADTGNPSPTRRAEELVDRMGDQIGHYAKVIGHGLLRFAARAREEAEDMWAEAQNIRRGQQP